MIRYVNLLLCCIIGIVLISSCRTIQPRSGDEHKEPEVLQDDAPGDVETATELAPAEIEYPSASTSGHVLRVQLFEQQKPASYQLSPAAGELLLTADNGSSIRLSPGSGPAEFGIKPGRQLIELQTGGRSYSSEKWTVHSSPNGMMRIAHPQLGGRFYKGFVVITAENQKLRTINHVDLEDYVASVVGGEMNFANVEALKVQAVISRTYALWNSTTSASNNRDYDLSDHVMSQVYPGELIDSPQYRTATEATSGNVITWSGKLILAAFHSTCGQSTTANEHVWSGNPLPYLRGQNCNGSCSASPHYRWSFEIKKSNLHAMFNAESLTQTNKDKSGRVASVTLLRNGAQTEVPANQFRLRLNQTHGIFALRSTFFELDEDADYYIFKGRGMGHGIGLCQWGTLGLAEAGWSYSDILRFYYNGADILPIEELGGSPFRLARF